MRKNCCAASARDQVRADDLGSAVERRRIALAARKPDQRWKVLLGNGAGNAASAGKNRPANNDDGDEEGEDASDEDYNIEDIKENINMGNGREGAKHDKISEIIQKMLLKNVGSE